MSQALFKPILAVGATGVAALTGYAFPESGVSDEASSIIDNFKRVFEHQQHAESLFGAKAQLISELREIASESAEDDWDGYGARRVSEAVVLRAEAFIRALPDNISNPEITAEPDGQISFDWLPARTKTFTLSVNAGNRLAYAWIDGANRGHAVELFEGNIVPVRVLEELQRIMRDGSTLRTA